MNILKSLDDRFLKWNLLLLGIACPATVYASDLPSWIRQSAPGVNTDAVLVYRDQKLLFEYYGNDYTADRKHLSWSMAKTVAGVLIAQEIDHGKLRLDTPIKNFFPSISGSATVQDLLQMSSGIRFKEEYFGIPVDADVTRMLYMDGVVEGMEPYLTHLGRRRQSPGHHFYYSSGDANLLMAILRKTSGTQERYDQVPFERFFEPLGISDATFEQSSDGIYVGSSYIYLKPTDYARIGHLLMNRGRDQGRSTIPEWYFELMTQVAPGVSEKPLRGTSFTRAYSSQITTNLPIPGRGERSEYPALPSDALIMIGHQGQLVIASPREKVVIIRLAHDGGSKFSRQQFLEKTAEWIKKSSERPYLVASEEQKDIDPNSTPQKKISIPLSFQTIKNIGKVPQLIRALGAKEYCSCIFVLERSEEQCREDLKASLPVLPTFEIDRVTEQPQVRAYLGTRILNRHSIAEYRGSKLGCRLKTSE